MWKTLVWWKGVDLSNIYYYCEILLDQRSILQIVAAGLDQAVVARKKN